MTYGKVWGRIFMMPLSKHMIPFSNPVIRES